MSELARCLRLAGCTIGAMVWRSRDPPAKRVGGFDFDLDLGLEFEVGPRDGTEGTNRISSRSGKGGKPGQGMNLVAGFRGRLATLRCAALALPCALAGRPHTLVRILSV